MNPKHARYVTRIEELIEEGKQVASSGRMSDSYVYIPDRSAVHAFLSKTENILQTVFGSGSAQSQHYKDFRSRHHHMERPDEILSVVGLLMGAKQDLEDGFLTGQEFLIASEVFDTLLEQAKHLNEQGYKDPAAVLMRVVLEDALKRLAREEGVDDAKKAALINDALKAAGRYTQPQWRLNQACLDVGNDAAHGKFDTFTKEDVTQRIDDVERFLATYFRS